MVKALSNPSASRGEPQSVARVCDPNSRSKDLGPRDRRQRFPKSRKLLRHADFQRVYKQGRRHFAPHMTVFYQGRGADNDQGGPRVGVTVGRALGGAVDRNRIKRRLREAIRYHLASLAAPVDVVINPKKSALVAEFQVLKAEVAHAFQAIGEKAVRDKDGSQRAPRAEELGGS